MCYSRSGRRHTTLGLVHIADGRRGQHVPGADIPAAVSHGRYRQPELRPVQMAAADERPDARVGHRRVRDRHVRQHLRDLRRVPKGNPSRSRPPQRHCHGALNGRPVSFFTPSFYNIIVIVIAADLRLIMTVIK